MNDLVVYLFLSLYRKALQSKIVKLQSHVSHLEALTSYEVPFNYGKPIDEVKDGQKARKLEMIRDGSQKALNFIQSYDADVVSLTVRSRKSGATQVLSLDKSPAPSSLESPSTSNKQVPVDEVLYLLDHYGVSDQFYHELSMVQPSLPRSYLVKRRRGELTKMVSTKDLFQPYKGHYRSFKEYLQEVLETEASE